MKKIKSFIKLSNRSLERLNEKEQSAVVGGAETGCYCGCFYSDCGGSSYYDNNHWNTGYDLKSEPPPPGGEWG